ncbi:hypothetical protein CJ739_2076 [Mariniflexile rhizosphaerae]|uniref:hypothetical protein n=1 Tax=unclassified Mariniflexile TaxID=2643887 RepID=UPI000CB31E15|nr:hypothetical protein [Mariniflexile sp. TRM1-10]AXP81157.1 hypothetical protein CJ739_2076 [Mariniflexile sp. TRM1-10]PLB18307.1 MAG: Secreted transmembrane protein [Flavobacteriaceae bacterium FS1-H7996/R]
MTTEEIKYSLTNNHLKLSLIDKLNHYGKTLIFLILPIIYVFLKVKSFFTHERVNSDNKTLIFVGVFTILGIIFLIIQKRQLKFKSIRTRLPENELIALIKKVCDEKEWTIYDFGKNYLKIKTFSDLLTGSFGEDITIILDKNLVLINSKCKLSKRNYLFSNPNTQNINVFFERIKANS